MKNGFKRYVLIIAILTVILNVLVFAIPFPKQYASFWISYAGAMIALLAQLYIAYLAFNGKETLKSKIYGLPIIRIGYIYLAVQMVITIICAIVGSFVEMPYWIVLILEVVLIGLAAIGLITTDTYRNEIEKMEQSEPLTTKFIFDLRVETKVLSECYQDSKYGKILSDLYEEVKFSDPKSNDSLIDIEGKISEKIIELKNELKSNNDNIYDLIIELINLIKERNIRCKASKK